MNLIKAFACLSLIILFSGCSEVESDHTIVTGTVTLNGVPITFPENFDEYPPTTQVIFQKSPTEAYFIQLKNDGTFTMTGHLNRGVPYGEYKVLIKQVGYNEPDGDLLEGKYNAENTPLKASVSSSSNDFTFNIEK